MFVNNLKIRILVGTLDFLLAADQFRTHTNIGFCCTEAGLVPSVLIRDRYGMRLDGSEFQFESYSSYVSGSNHSESNGQKCRLFISTCFLGENGTYEPTSSSINHAMLKL